MTESRGHARRPGYDKPQIVDIASLVPAESVANLSKITKRYTSQVDGLQRTVNKATQPMRNLIDSLPMDYLDDLRETVRHLNIETGKLIASIDIPDVSRYYRMARDQSPALVTAVNNFVTDPEAFESATDRIMGSIENAFHRETTLKPEWWYDLPEEYADQVDSIAKLSLEMYHDNVKDGDEDVKLTVMQERLFNHYARNVQRTFGTTEGRLITTTSDNYVKSVLDAREFESAPFNVMAGALPIMNDGDNSMTVPVDMEWDQSGQ